MKVTVRIMKEGKLEDIVHDNIFNVLWDGDWVRIVPMDSRIYQTSYRKDLVFAVIEEGENHEDTRD